MTTFTSRELVVQGAQLPLPPVDPTAKLRQSIQHTLGGLKAIPTRWIEFDAYHIPDEQLALIIGELVVEGWEAKIHVQRFAPFHSYSGLPKPKFLCIRG